MKMAATIQVTIMMMTACFVFMPVSVVTGCWMVMYLSMLMAVSVKILLATATPA
jgi:hypothetical protein